MLFYQLRYLIQLIWLINFPLKTAMVSWAPLLNIIIIIIIIVIIIIIIIIIIITPMSDQDRISPNNTNKISTR